MSIISDVNEIESLKKELKDLRKRMKALRTQEKSATQRIIEYLQVKGHPGVKHKGTAIELDLKPKRGPKKEDIKKNDSLEVLNKFGVRDAEALLEELLEARKGSPKEIPKLKFKKYKEK